MIISLILYYFLVGFLIPEPQLNGSTLLTQSITFHDPDGKWASMQIQFDFEETRPNDEPRYTSIGIDNRNGDFCMTRIVNGREVKRHVVDGRCLFQIGENSDISEADVSELRLTEERTLFMRNYYLYLWGLPMKLKDEGTIVHETVETTEFNNKRALKMKVTYEAETGSDIWYFYMDPQTSEMKGYQFYHDEAVGDGEYILLDDSEYVQGMKIPNRRSWYTNKDSTLLGTDSYTSASELKTHH